MSPLLRKAEVAGMIGMRKKRQPNLITMDDFFGTVDIARDRFAMLVDTDQPSSCVVIPSVSYGIANAVNNIALKHRQNIVMMHQIFPSNYYGWEQKARDAGAEIRVVQPPSAHSPDGHTWTQLILDAIDEHTAVVNISHVHWADGSLFDLSAIAEKIHRHDGFLIVDGTQSIGAYPLSVRELGIDVLVASSYKWMLGPYSIGMAYYSDRLHHGTPIEQSWLNRVKSDDFAALVDYQMDYRQGARRYEVGEASNFILLPMMIAGMDQLLEWTPERVQGYCQSLVTPGIEVLRQMGYRIAKRHRASHLFGIRLAEGMDMKKVQEALDHENIIVSYRGDAIRVSPGIYTEDYEMDILVDALKDVVSG